MTRCNCPHCMIIGPGSGHHIDCPKCGYHGNSYYHHCKLYKAQQKELGKRLKRIKLKLKKYAMHRINERRFIQTINSKLHSKNNDTLALLSLALIIV